MLGRTLIALLLAFLSLPAAAILQEDEDSLTRYVKTALTDHETRLAFGVSLIKEIARRMEAWDGADCVSVSQADQNERTTAIINRVKRALDRYALECPEEIKSDIDRLDFFLATESTLAGADRRFILLIGIQRAYVLYDRGRIWSDRLFLTHSWASSRQEASDFLMDTIMAALETDQ